MSILQMNKLIHKKVDWLHRDIESGRAKNSTQVVCLQNPGFQSLLYASVIKNTDIPLTSIHDKW